MIVTGRAKKVHPIMYGLGLLFILFVIILQTNG
jgi:AGZA family xanthine/uracil permease-like MFS transporter